MYSGGKEKIKLRAGSDRVWPGPFRLETMKYLTSVIGPRGSQSRHVDQWLLESLLSLAQVSPLEFVCQPVMVYTEIL